MKIRACMKCGSTNLRTRAVSEGLIPGDMLSTNKLICNDCGYIGVPIVFDSMEEQKTFSERKHKSQT
ncbi:MAG: hypothetical protein QMD21_05845 [Candidatus Thermoplasmatota archaeon]|nr:hypothetical protein [Candidatus Thermoplasmatota archaeon]MDI6887235.1 hypothetical protein [Candidatus Thermoplasmatota archaeon]